MKEGDAFMKKQRINTRLVAYTGITAALYMAATLMIAPFAYGPVQFRISEVLVLLAFIDPAYGPGLILGCALANLFSPLGVMDLVFGTAGTLCTVLCITRTKNLFTATLWPTVFCIFVGLELSIVDHLPFLYTTLTVMAGEFAVVTVMGYPLFKGLMKNKKLIENLKIGK